ncbi:MAG: chorismate-binding protein [Cyanobacteria bacterium J083]|nr:MAG: chorismate-binding protein [Cyanobacteria bacterium J083]
MTVNINQDNNLLLQLATLMAGDWSNQEQSWQEPRNYAHIHLFFRPLPWEFFQGIGFYSEQVYDYDLWTPYRQGVHKLIQRRNDVYIENYSLNDSFSYAGAGHNPEILKTITPQVINRRYNCSMIFTKDPVEEKFLGAVEPGNQCLITKEGRETYLVSTVELTASSWLSWDRGLDTKTHEQVWGSKTGPLIFSKKASFAHELPQDFM